MAAHLIFFVLLEEGDQGRNRSLGVRSEASEIARGVDARVHVPGLELVNQGGDVVVHCGGGQQQKDHGGGGHVRFLPGGRPLS